MERIIKILAGMRLRIQIFWIIMINSDIAIIAKILEEKKAFISNSGLKKFCIPSLNCYSCPSARFSCPIGILQFYINDSATRITFKEKISFTGMYIIGFFIFTGITVGRLWCGFMCPFGLFQDVLSKLFKKNVLIPKSLRFLKYFVLIFFVLIIPAIVTETYSIGPGFCKFICPSGTFFAGIPLILSDGDFRNTIGIYFGIKLTILISIIIALIFIKRFFCKTLCPLGAFWGLFNKISYLKMSVDKEKCTKCGICEKKCPMNVSILSEINSVECIRCMKCLKNCNYNCIKIINKKEK